MRTLVAAFLTFLSIISHAQVRSVDSLTAKHLNWHLADPTSDEIMGISATRAWNELLVNRQAKDTIVVAVIDSGIDIEHEDLKNSLWVNTDEIPNNQIDDDSNGYVDDIHGWNFIGNSKGENVNQENLEFTRIYRAGTSHPDYVRARQAYETELDKRKKEKDNVGRFEQNFMAAKSIIKTKTGIEIKTVADFENIPASSNPQLKMAIDFLKPRYENGFTEKVLKEIKDNNNDYLNYFLNVDFNPRTIVGDNPAEISGVYGNPDVEGPRADHGTGVAGVIAAARNNGVGIEGIAANVRIMCIRSTPRGDERDKDVAMAIRYAVDNGARIINMSFGKDFSPEKRLVDDAVKYAEQRNVLLVHASGNDGKNVDVEPNFPSNRYLSGGKATNWLAVGASDREDNEELVAVFSNYGIDQVDLFAPGANIITLDDDGTYNMHDGTSLAGPIAAGVAALVLSYHPELTPQQLIEVLMQSATKRDKLKVLEPGRSEDRKKVKFSQLSRSGGIVNAYDAIKKADELYPNR